MMFEVGDAEADPNILEQRRLQVQSKLSARQEARKQIVDEKKESGEGNKNPAQSSAAFFARFEDLRKEIEAKLIDYPSTDRATIEKHFNEASDINQALRDLLAQSSVFLSSFDVQQAQKTIDTLVERTSKVRMDALPKKKFAFSSAKRKAGTPSSSPSEEASKQDSPSPPQSNKVNDHSRTYRDRSGENIVVPSTSEIGQNEALGDLTFSNLSDCEIHVSRVSTAVRLDLLTRCQVYLAPTNGSIFIESCNSCTFVSASRQIRIHETNDCEFYIYAMSRPTIENCKNVGFAPYSLSFPQKEALLQECGFDLSNNKWDDVQDFNWLKPDSPHWSRISEDQRRTHEL